MKNKILIAFSRRIRAERVKKKMSQEELAEKAGVHRTYIGMIERAEKNITLKNIEKISLVLKTTLSDLFKGL